MPQWDDQLAGLPDREKELRLLALQIAALGTGAPVFDIHSYGAVGDGTTDDTTAVRAAIAAANTAGGGRVIFRAGLTYKLSNGDGLGSFMPGSHVHIIRWGAQFDYSGFGLSSTAWAPSGSLGTHYALTADTTVGGTTVQITAGQEANFAVDQYVLVGSEAYYETRTVLYGAGTGTKSGEICRVKTISSGLLTFYNSLAGGYVDTSGTTHLNYKVSDTAFVAPLTMLEDCWIHGGLDIGTTGSGTGSSQACVQMYYGVNVGVVGARAKHFGYLGYGLRSCVESRLDVAGADFWNTNNGYCASVADACQDCEVHVLASKCRHAFTTESVGGHYGVVRRIQVTGKSWYTVSTGDAFDSHAAAEDISYINCDSFSSAGQGINFEGSRCTIIGGTHRYSASHGIGVHNETLMPGMCTVKGTRIIRPGIGGATAHGIVWSAPVTAGANTTLWGLDLDAEVHYPTGIGIWAAGSSTIQYDDCRISGIVFFSQSTTAAFYTQYIDHVAMVGCIAKNVIASSVGLRIDNGNYGTITGCGVFGASATSSSGVYVKNSTHIVIADNALTGLAKGVNLDNTSSSCTVTGNDATGNTTPISPGTGAGHRIDNNQGDVQGPITYTPGASPDTYTNTSGRRERMVISGGTVTTLKISCDATNYYTTGVTAGVFTLNPGDQIQDTYSSVPTTSKRLPLP